MKAIVATNVGADFREVATPALLTETDVRVRVHSVSICRTDLYGAEGRLKVDAGRILGHEFAGVVESTDSDGSLSIGDRVVGHPSLHCNHCRVCRAGATHRCADAEFLGLDRDGAFAELVVLPGWALHRLADEVPFSVGTFAEPVAAGMAIFEAGLKPHDRVLVYGSSRIARLTGELLADAGFNKFEIAADLTGLNSDQRFDAIIETCGLGAGMDPLIDKLEPGGVLVVKSREPTAIEVPVLNAIRRQVRIQAVKYGTFEDALAFVERHPDMLATYLDDQWELENFEEAFELARASEDKKICFKLVD
jgi:threonine dehydrogenase-like Zn-dependent dehydrogenase